MASDTATLDIERVQAERDRIEAKRDAAQRVELGPDDRAPEDSGPIDVDPATRAHLIVQEVLASAAPASAVEIDVPVTTDDSAAGRARRIVEEVLAAAQDAPTTDAPTTDADAQTNDEGATADAGPELPEVRTDFVLLGLPQPVVLVPGPVFEARPAAFTPRTDRDLPELVDEALGTFVTDEAPRNIREAIHGAAETASMPGMRWVVAGAVWAAAFALVVPLAFKGVLSSVDLTVDLWGDQTATAEATTAEAATATP